jgi:hypothetical protein
VNSTQRRVAGELAKHSWKNLPHPGRVRLCFRKEGCVFSEPLQKAGSAEDARFCWLSEERIIGNPGDESARENPRLMM